MPMVSCDRCGAPAQPVYGPAAAARAQARAEGFTRKRVDGKRLDLCAACTVRFDTVSVDDGYEVSVSVARTYVEIDWENRGAQGPQPWVFHPSEARAIAERLTTAAEIAEERTQTGGH